MTAFRDPDRLIHAFLREGEDTLHDQVYDAVRGEIEKTRQRAVIGPWRISTMNRFLAIGAAALAVLVVVVIGSQLLGPPANVGSGGDATPTPQPTPEPSATQQPTPEPTSTPDAGLPVGPFTFEPDGSFSSNDSGMTLTVTIPDFGWGFYDDWNLLGPVSPDDAPFIAFWAFPSDEFYVPGDPCRADSSRPATPATTVDEIAGALAAQASRNASEPVDVTIGGYAGKSLMLHAPENVDDADCERGEVITYFTTADDFWRNTQRPDEVSELWILDVGGTIMIIDAVSSPDDSAELVETMRGVVESTTFDVP